MDHYYAYITESLKENNGVSVELKEHSYSLYLRELLKRLNIYSVNASEIKEETKTKKMNGGSYQEVEEILDILTLNKTFFLQYSKIFNFFSFDDVKDLSELTILCCGNFLGINMQFDKMFFELLPTFTENLLDNLRLIRNESIIYSIGEILMELCLNEAYFNRMLTLNFFLHLYQLSSCEKFTLSNEMFHLLYYMLESDKINRLVFRDFIIREADKIVNEMVNTLTYFISFEETYMVERDSLVFFKKLIMNPQYLEFRLRFLNNPYNLKIVLMELNNDCHKIRIEALYLLHEFFVEIENLEEIVHTLLLDNKDNFYKMFEINGEVFTSIDSNEKKNFILCELERIDTR